jgi:hypothetical protein
MLGENTIWTTYGMYWMRTITDLSGCDPRLACELVGNLRLIVEIDVRLLSLQFSEGHLSSLGAVWLLDELVTFESHEKLLRSFSGGEVDERIAQIGGRLVGLWEVKEVALGDLHDFLQKPLRRVSVRDVADH